MVRSLRRAAVPAALLAFATGTVLTVATFFALLVAFVAGIVIGLLAWVPTVVRQRREVARLKKTAARLAAMNEAPAAAPAAPEPPPPAIMDVHGI
jgi:hypothetical protein